MYVPRPPHFSEFSYGFAVTREFVAAEGENIRIAPVFPSLLAEAGLGWDVLLERSGMPMFLQFKLSDCMKGPRAMEAKRGDFAPPFFRFHLRCGKDMNQHSPLVELNNRGENVRYIAPAFYLSDDLNEAYRTNTVVDQSIQIAPNQIGNLPVGRHHVTFSSPTGPWKPYSEGEHRETRRAGSGRELLKSAETEFRSRPRSSIRVDLQRIDAELLDVFTARKEERADFRRIQVADVLQQRPLERIEFISRYFFDCQLFFAIEK
jgi:hypothetical protein